MREIQINNCTVWDCCDSKFGERPETKYLTDFDNFIKTVTESHDTIFDLLWFYNATGLLVEIIRYYRVDCGFNYYNIGVSHTIFGTYVKENNTDKIFPQAETGPYNLGTSPSWDQYQDIVVWEDEVRDIEQLDQDIKDFYKTDEILI